MSKFFKPEDILGVVKVVLQEPPLKGLDTYYYPDYEVVADVLHKELLEEGGKETWNPVVYSIDFPTREQAIEARDKALLRWLEKHTQETEE